MRRKLIIEVFGFFCLFIILASPILASNWQIKNVNTDNTGFSVITPVSVHRPDINYSGTHIDVTAPNDINLGVMTVGGPTYGSGICSVSTDADTWTVSVSDTATGYPGQMVATGSVYLTQQLQIGKTLPADHNASSGFNYNQSDGLNNLPFYVSQQVESSDSPGSYSITITFVGTY